MDFSHLIRIWRKEAGMTLEELADKTNLSFQAISLYENGKRNVSLDTLKLFAKVFNKEIEFSTREKGNIPTTDKQRGIIKTICENERYNEIYNQLKDLFQISEEEISAGKLFDDMTETEYIRHSPSRITHTSRGEIIHTSIHREELELYYLCMGGEYEYKTEYRTSLQIPYGIPEFIPPRRTTKDGFITEQRRLLLVLLISCFKTEYGKVKSFDLLRFKKEIGF